MDWFGNGSRHRDTDDVYGEESRIIIKEFVPGEPAFTARFFVERGPDQRYKHVTEKEVTIARCGHAIESHEQLGPPCPCCHKSVCATCSLRVQCKECLDLVCLGCANAYREAPYCNRCIKTVKTRTRAIDATRAVAKGTWAFIKFMGGK